MPLLNTIHPQQAEGKTAEVYREIEGMFGFVPNAIRLNSINPGHMARHWEGIKEAIGHETLSDKLFTLIRLLLSEATQCDYCIGLNTSLLVQSHGMSLAEIAQVKQTLDAAPLDQKEKALLRFVMQGVSDSNSISADDIGALKQLGVSDREIFDALAHGAWHVANDVMINTFKVERDFL
jgi:uncharacterized peroxidase-related enzyme